MKVRYLILMALSVLCACSRGNAGPGYQELIDRSDSLVTAQEYDQATRCALDALEIARSSGNSAAQSEVLSHLAALDIVTWRDAQAWEHACEAEQLARQTGIDTLIAKALTQKGRVCMCAGIEEGEGRDAEAIDYLNRALELGSESVSCTVDAYYSLGQTYVNLNRFKDNIDQDIYAKAGECFDRGIECAQNAGRQDLVRRSLLPVVRWLRQGGRIQEAVNRCLDVLAGCGEQDLLMKSQTWDQLTMLYALLGDVQNSANAHQQYVYNTEHYMRRKADHILQDMETRYETALKNVTIRGLRAQRLLLAAVVILLGAIVFVALRLNRKIVRENAVKEQLLGFIAKDLTKPGFNKQINDTLREMSSLDDEGIKARAKELFAESNALDESTLDYVVRLVHERKKNIGRFNFTRRELEVLQLSREGLSAAQIAEKLNISTYTVNNHKQRIYNKMNVRNNAEMLHAADEAGL